MIESEVWNFILIALYRHHRRFLSASLLIIPSSLRRKIKKGRKLRNELNISEVLKPFLHPVLFPSPLRKLWFSSGRVKVVLPWRRSSRNLWEFLLSEIVKPDYARALENGRPGREMASSRGRWCKERSCLEISHQMLERSNPGEDNHPPVESSSAVLS